MKKAKGLLVSLFAGCVGSAALAGGYWAYSEARYKAAIQEDGVCVAVPEEAPATVPVSFSSRPADGFYGALPEEKQFLLFGDTDHSDYRIGDFFYSSENLDDLAKAGVKHIFIERGPESSQKGIDDLAAGRMMPEDFATNYVGGAMWDRDGAYDARVRMAQGVVYAAKLGMQIHASDVKTKGIATKAEREELYAFYGDMSAAFNEACPGSDHMTDRFYEAYRERRYFYLLRKEERFDEIMQERYNDENRVALIRSIAGSEKSAVLYGAAHFSGPKSIHALLGIDKTVQINIFPSREKMSEYGLSVTSADFSYLVEEGEIYQTGDMAFPHEKAAPPSGNVKPAI